MRPSVMTRTITTYHNDVTVLKKDTDEVVRKTVDTVRPTGKEIANQLPENEKLLAVHSQTKTKRQYKMSLENFMKYAE